MRGLKLLTLLGCGAVLWGGPSAVVYGQANGSKGGASAAPTAFSIEVKDGSVRAALTQLFEAAHVQYSIDQRVSGFETLHIVDQPFDSALRVLMRSSSQTLAYSVEGGVYYVSVRESSRTLPAGITSIVSESSPFVATGPKVDVLTLTYADPYDLKDLLGIKIIPTGTRAGGGGTTGGSTGTAAGSAGGSKSNAGGGAPNVSGGGTINAGSLISNDANNDILRIK